MYRSILPWTGAGLFAFSGQCASAAVTISFSQSGADTVVTASGTLDLAGMSWTDRVEPGTGTGEPLLFKQIAGNFPQDIVRLLSSSFQIYRMPGGTDFFANQFGVLVAAESFGQTFGIWSDGTETCLYVPARFTSGSISGSMVFENVDLDSLGVIEQVVSFGATDGKKVNLVVVPEPSAGLLAAGGLGLVLVRRRSRG